MYPFFFFCCIQNFVFLVVKCSSLVERGTKRTKGSVERCHTVEGLRGQLSCSLAFLNSLALVGQKNTEDTEDTGSTDVSHGYPLLTHTLVGGTLWQYRTKCHVTVEVKTNLMDLLLYDCIIIPLSKYS